MQPLADASTPDQPPEGRPSRMHAVSNHCCNHRTVVRDRYATLPSPAWSVFDRRMTTVPDPSSAGSISSIDSDTNSSRRHIVSYATATKARSRMSLKFRSSNSRNTAISDHTNPRAWRCRAAIPRDISFKLSFTSSDEVGSKTPAARCARPIVAVNADFYALRNSRIFTCHLVVSLTGLKVPIGPD
jgi:hypothetical protein